MNSSFYTAITGAKSQQVAVDTTGNNIANINTAGYRGSQTEFATLYSKTLAVNYETQVSNQGLGSRVSATAIDMRAGTYQSTGNTFDVAIDGNGWFGAIATNTMDAKQVGYTRDGSFSVDENSHLVNQSGHYILGSSHGNLINENGSWRVDPAVQAGGLTTPAAQGILTVPNELTYPAVATTQATLSANLPGKEGSKTQRADLNADLSALFDPYGRPLNIATGESVLLAAGEETVQNQGGLITLAKTLPDDQTGPLTLTINGTEVTAEWADGADRATVAQAVADAFNTQPGITATAENGSLVITSASTLSISGSSNTALFGRLNAQIVSYNDTPNTVATLKDLKSAIEQTAQGVYGPSVFADYGYDGAIKLSASEPIAFQIDSESGEESALANMLESLETNGGTPSTLAFYQAYHRGTQDAVSPSGEKRRIETVLVQTRPAAGDEQPLWEATATLSQNTAATANSPLSDLVYHDDALNLADGEDLWFAFGKQPASTTQGYGYSMTLTRDETNGTDPTLRFMLDGQQFNITASDGAEIHELQSALENTLGAAGYETQRSGTNLIIYPKGDSLLFTNGETNLPNISLDSMSLGRVTYGESGVQTLGDLAEAIDAIGAPLQASAALSQGQLQVKNGSFNTVALSVLSGDNTSEAFRKSFVGLATVMPAGAQSNAVSFNEWKTLSTQSRTVTFDDGGRITGPGTLTLDNGGEPLAVNLDLTAWQQQAMSHSFVQNGVFEGRLEGYTIAEDGALIANFSNAQSSTIGHLAVYHFVNDQGLMRIGGNLFMESANSGEPFFYLDENGNPTAGATVKGQMLEGSNVQSAVALTELIIHQRAYEGNAKAITTSDELIKNAIQMKR